jgi:nicotinate-nucleotide--dimethylbenzimidazole phosphoribosyltransferase
MNFSEKLQHQINVKTKPLGALGRLESLAFQIGNIQQTLQPQLRKPVIIVFAGDHGIANAGVSSYPQAVTQQMVLNFLNGGAAINVFCKQHALDLKIVDAGVNFDFPENPKLINQKIRKSTHNFLEQPAMTASEQELCFEKSKVLINQIAENGSNVIGFGEMGIGNTSSATMLMSILCGLPIEDCVGRGTGLSNEQLSQKTAVLKQAKALYPSFTSPEAVLQTFGGFEIAQLCGAMLAAFERNMLLLVDGFIAGSAFLVAYKIKPEIRQNAVFCHLSDEQGHAKLLNYLEASPVLNLNMRLGEGSGCAVAYPILQSAVAFLNEMASFESAGVSTNDLVELL